jgi:hypothetical protein
MRHLDGAPEKLQYGAARGLLALALLFSWLGNILDDCSNSLDCQLEIYNFIKPQLTHVGGFESTLDCNNIAFRNVDHGVCLVAVNESVLHNSGQCGFTMHD